MMHRRRSVMGLKMIVSRDTSSTASVCEMILSRGEFSSSRRRRRRWRLSAKFENGTVVSRHRGAGDTAVTPPPPPPHRAPTAVRRRVFVKCHRRMQTSSIGRKSDWWAGIIENLSANKQCLLAFKFDSTNFSFCWTALCGRLHTHIDPHFIYSHIGNPLPWYGLVSVDDNLQLFLSKRVACLVWIK